MGDRTKYLENAHYSVLTPIFAALRFLSRDRQAAFDYRLLSRDRIFGKDAFVLEAVPKVASAAGLEKAKMWVARRGFQILRIETQGVPLAGYDDVFEDATRLLVKPAAKITHDYRLERNGVMFPDRVTVEIRYPTPVADVSVPKLKIDLKYDKYKFFTVETEHEIIR